MAIDLEAWELRHLEIDDPQRYNNLEGETHEEKLETYKRLKEEYRIANNPVTKALQRLKESRQGQSPLILLDEKGLKKMWEREIKPNLTDITYNSILGDTDDEKFLNYARDLIIPESIKRGEKLKPKDTEKIKYEQIIKIGYNEDEQSPGQAQAQSPGQEPPPLDTPEKVQAEIDKTLAKLMFHSCIEKVKNEYRLTGNYIPKIIDLLELFIKTGDISVPTFEGIPDFIKTHIKKIDGGDIKNATRQAIFQKKEK